MDLFLHLLFQVTLVTSAFAGTVPEGETCTTAGDHLDPSSHRFLSDCDEKNFCSGSLNGICRPKLCRRDQFPFGFQVGDALPPLCPRGTFCPDQGSGCQHLIPVGQPCQLNRDDQCAPPKDFESLASDQNFNGSLCLHSICTFANATLGHKCFLDTTTYVQFGPDGQQLNFTVTRHNCRTPQLYCDPDAFQCLPVKAVGLSCSSDQECGSLNCNSKGTCSHPPEMPLEVQPWQYAITILAVLLAISIIVTMLVGIHKRIRLQHYHDIREYYEEQLSLRHSLFALHNAASEISAEEKL